MTLKECDYCGRENPDEALQCHECATKFAPANANATGEEADSGPPAPPHASKVGFIVAAFALAMLAMLPLGGFLALQPFLILSFPSGLWGLFKQSDPNSMSAIGGWIIYAGAITALILSRRRRWFILFYVVLCFTLAANVTGCYSVVSTILQGVH